MKDYTIKIFNENLQVVEYHISATSMLSAERIAYTRYNELGLASIIRVETKEG